MKTLMALAALIGGQLTTADLPPPCPTHIEAAAASAAACTMPADAYHTRFFYLHLPVRAGGVHRYQAHSHPVAFFVDNARHRVPPGAGVACAGACRAFPITLDIDARHLHEEHDEAVVRFFVPPADMSSVLTVQPGPPDPVGSTP